MKLNEYLEDFADADPEEALEMLMDYSARLPALSPPRAAEGQPARCRVQECQTPVYLWIDVEGGRVRVEASVHEKSPTVRGFVALLTEGISGATPAEIASLPDDLLPKLNLQETLGMTRQRGFKGIIARIKREVGAAVTQAAIKSDFL